MMITLHLRSYRIHTDVPSDPVPVHANLMQIMQRVQTVTNGAIIIFGTIWYCPVPNDRYQQYIGTAVRGVVNVRTLTITSSLRYYYGVTQN